MKTRLLSVVAVLTLSVSLSAWAAPAAGGGNSGGSASGATGGHGAATPANGGAHQGWGPGVNPATAVPAGPGGPLVNPSTNGGSAVR